MKSLKRHIEDEMSHQSLAYNQESKQSLEINLLKLRQMPEKRQSGQPTSASKTGR